MVTQYRVMEGGRLIEICEELNEAKVVAREFIQESLNFEVQVHKVRSEFDKWGDMLIDREDEVVFEIEKYEDNTIEEFTKA